MQSNPISNRKLLWVPIITILAGFIPFCLLSIYYGVFWINTKYDVPLIYNISVMIGDFILLPLINYQICKLIFWDISVKQLTTKKETIVTWIIITLLLSTVLNVFAHLTWKNDLYSDFISIDRSTFLLSGWWHLFFSSLEMTILFLFPLFWFMSIKQKSTSGIKRSFKIWLLLFLFTTLAIFDMLMKFFFVYKLSLLSTIKTDYFAFITPTISILLLIIMVSITTRIQKTE